MPLLFELITFPSTRNLYHLLFACVNYEIKLLTLPLKKVKDRAICVSQAISYRHWRSNEIVENQIIVLDGGRCLPRGLRRPTGRRFRQNTRDWVCGRSDVAKR
jgi:hypothetical protein